MKGTQGISVNSNRKDNLDGDQHSNKIKDLLKNDLMMLQQQNVLLKDKCRHLGDLQEKIDVLVKHNAQLLTQNQKLSKLANQRRSQIEIMKNKYDSQLQQQKIGETASHEFELKKLMAEIDHLNNQMKQIDHIRNTQINEIKSQHQIQIKTFKKQQINSNQMYQFEIRKLRDQLDKRQFQLSQYVNKLKRVSSQSQYQILKLKEEKEKMRNQLIYLQTDRKNDIEAIRTKLQANYIDQIDNIRKNHFQNQQAIQIQNIKLKDALQNKSMELEQITTKLIKQKNHYEDTIIILRKQNQNVRGRLIQLQRLNEAQFQSLKLKLNKVHESQIQQIKANSNRYIQCIQTQVLKLQGHLKNKNEEIEQLIKQKNVVRQTFQSQNNTLKDQNNSLRHKNNQLEKILEKTASNYEVKIKQKEKSIQYFQRLNQDQNNNNRKQQTSLKQLLQHTKSQLESLKISSKQKQQSYKQSLNQITIQNQNLRQAYKKQKSNKERIQQDLKSQLQGTSLQLKSQIDGVNSSKSAIERQNQVLKNTLAHKEKQNLSLKNSLNFQNARQKSYENQIQQLKSKMIKKEQKITEELSKQKHSLDNSYKYKIQNLTHDYENSLKLQANRYKDLQEKLKRKQLQLQDLLKKFKKMEIQINEIVNQEANKKQLTIKYPGASADLIASKNLFDVYLKTKVLNLCGDALQEKQNFKE